MAQLLTGFVVIAFFFPHQFFKELATDSKPEKADEVAVKDLHGKQVILGLKDLYCGYPKLYDKLYPKLDWSPEM